MGHKDSSWMAGLEPHYKLINWEIPSSEEQKWTKKIQLQAKTWFECHGHWCYDSWQKDWTNEERGLLQMKGGGTFVLRLQEDAPKICPSKETGIQRSACPDKGSHKCLRQRGSGKVLWRSTGGGFLIQRPRLMLASLTNILTVFNRSINENSFTIPIKINEKNVETETLIDSGAGGKFIDQNYTRTSTLLLQNLTKPIPALNIDGTLNKKGTIKHYINLNLDILDKNKQCVY